MFLWYIIKDRVHIADLLAFSPGKKRGKKSLPLHVYFRWKLHWTEAQKPGGAVTPSIPQNLHSCQARMWSILKSASHTGMFVVPSKLRHVNKRNEWGQKSVWSFSGKGHAVVGPLQRPVFLWGSSSFSNQTHSLPWYLCCGEGKVYVHRKFPMSRTLRKMCGW